MKIVFLVRRFYPDLGGVEKHVMEVSKRLVTLGHEIIVITELTNSNNTYEEVEGIKIYRINAGKDEKQKKYNIWKSLWQYKHILKSADIIHCHDVFFWYLPFRFIFPAKPVYTTFHGYEGYPIAKKAITNRKLAERLSWGNICIGAFITKWYGTKSTYLSYGGVNFQHKSKGDKPEENSSLFFGRLDHLNGITTYADAIDIVRKKYSHFTFLVIGDGPYRKQLREYTKVLPPQSNPEIFLRKYQFAFVSGYLSMLEAMAEQRLVFAVYNNPLKEDYLKMTPFAEYIVMSNNAHELAEKVMFYISHPEEEKRLTDKAYAWVKNQTWDIVVTQYLQLWSSKKQQNAKKKTV